MCKLLRLSSGTVALVCLVALGSLPLGADPVAPAAEPAEPAPGLAAGHTFQEYVIPSPDASRSDEVSEDYVLGPGDVLSFNVWGRAPAAYTLTVSPEGKVFVPETGQLQAAGISIREFRRNVTAAYARDHRDFDLSVLVTHLRTMKVYAVGQVARPGLYVVPSVTRVLDLIGYAKGITATGSSRRIEIRRDNGLAATFDLVDFLAKGAVEQNILLNAGEVVFVPDRGPCATITGEVKRPGLHELKAGETVRQLIEEAGGVTADASLSHARLSRVVGGERKGFVPFDLAGLLVRKDPACDVVLQDGDDLVIPALGLYLGTVTVSGEVKKAGPYELKENMRLSDVLSLCGGVTDQAALREAYVERTLPDEKREQVAVDLAALLHDGSQEQNLVLQRGDLLYVPPLSMVQDTIRVVGELKALRSAQASSSEDGRAIPPATGDLSTTYMLRRGERVKSVVEHLGGPTPHADLRHARVERAGPEGRAQIISVDLYRLLVYADADQDVALQRGDTLVVPALPDKVYVTGEVNRPGAFDYREGRLLLDYVGQAGGATRRARLAYTKVIRQDGEKLSLVEVDLGKAMSHPQQARSLQVYPGDVIILTERSVVGWQDLVSILGGLGSFRYIFVPPK